MPVYRPVTHIHNIKYSYLLTLNSHCSSRTTIKIIRLINHRLWGIISKENEPHKTF